jgi:hypothetical protein
MHPVHYIVITLTTGDFSQLSRLTVRTTANDGCSAREGGDTTLRTQAVMATPGTVSELLTTAMNVTSRAQSLLVDIWDDRYIARRGK